VASVVVLRAAEAEGADKKKESADEEKAKEDEVDAEEDEDDEDDEYDDEDEDEFEDLGYDDVDDEDEYDEVNDNSAPRLEARCKAKNLRGSADKFRRVLWQIRGRSYRDALMMLEFMPWRACKPVLVALQSAAANAQNHLNMDKSRLYVSYAQAMRGPKRKRMRPVSKGMAHPYNKHQSHVIIKVAERDED